MRKVLLLIISLFIAQATIAYETVLIDFPENEGWHSVYYKTQDGEAILQYVPKGETYEEWTRSLVFHSYKDLSWTNSAAAFMDKTTAQMQAQNSSQRYEYLKYTEMDSYATRCVDGNKIVPTQCEIYRTAKSAKGLISMHYINKNVKDYKANYDTWLWIVKNIRIYQSYYRDNVVMDKETSFEL